ncbi:MarR family winged helix-turn-helix transcriptional regulator [Candidatus Xianfuyuplasma coldseepsis]|uniref:MarR family transcriptional regulator n=1 Tax=Candidatus Xianfuyuplasma coldseepsis TaxID=2782163 RepID=A0A7L7KUQ2_9MOLU|nr:MarR family transcriptional regulator [Xianfuyuplasma coldseepsis]QMS85724.1 MarR family transcriptional regulator [Xianfuyuplasma coldseepsis]
MVKEICYKLNKSSMLYKRLMSKHLEEMNITYAQLMVLRVIDAEPGITAKEILLQMDTDKATLSGVISRLERDNYIYRVQNDKDGRVRNIYVSEGSEKLCADVNVIEEACMKELMSGIKEEDAEHFLHVLDMFIANQVRKIDEKF